MGHAIHFLQRLERVGEAESSLALRLYQTPGLLSELLSLLGLDGGVERLAISLKEGDKGPHLVVTREGDFVTCLAPGMGLDGLERLSFQAFGTALRQAESLLERREIGTSLTEGEGLESLLERLLGRGHELSREEMLGLSALQPMLCMSFLRALFQAFDELESLRAQVVRFKKLRQAEGALLERYHRLHWGMGHLLVLCAWEGRGPLGPFLELMGELEPGPSLSWMTFRQGDHALCTRSLWSIGRVGKPLLAFYKEQFVRVESPLGWLEGLLALLILGLRHKKLKAQVQKILGQRPEIPATVRACWPEQIDDIADWSARILAQPQEVLAEQTVHYQRLLWQICQQKEMPESYQFATAEDCPPGLALALSVNLSVDTLNDHFGVTLLLQTLPWLAQAQAEELYLPGEFVVALERPWRVEDSLALARRRREFYGKPQPAVASVKIGRNAPCPCGSGKKYKRCCGHER